MLRPSFCHSRMKRSSRTQSTCGQRGAVEVLELHHATCRRAAGYVDNDQARQGGVVGGNPRRRASVP